MFSFLNKLSNLQQRFVAGLTGAALVITSICYNQWTYFLLFFAICLFSLLEFYKLINSAGIGTNKYLATTIGLLIYTATFLLEISVVTPMVFFIIIPLLFILFLVELFQTHEKPFERLAFSILGILYIAVPFAMLHYATITNETYNFKIIFGILFLLWANDIGGYFGGRYMGKHKLYERISPKKTWEGSLSGALFSLLVSIGLYYSFGSLSLSGWLILSLIIVIMGSLGDLIESQLKRSLQIKDSGQSIPGHGGFMDRFDGLFFSAPFIALYFEIFA
jgi:phosphatidate cytidylyltransferase